MYIFITWRSTTGGLLIWQLSLRDSYIMIHKQRIVKVWYVKWDFSPGFDLIWFNIYIGEPISTIEQQIRGEKSVQTVGDEAVALLFCSPLREYCKPNSHRFPCPSKIAINVFGQPASSGNTERAFGTALDILSAKGNRLEPEPFQSFMLIKKNCHLVNCSVNDIIFLMFISLWFTFSQELRYAKMNNSEEENENTCFNAHLVLLFVIKMFSGH